MIGARGSTRRPTRRPSSRRSCSPARWRRSRRPQRAPRRSPRRWPAWPSCSSSGPAARWSSACFASSLSMQSGAPTFGTPEPALLLYAVAQLARRLGVPFRSGGSLCASKIAGRPGGLRDRPTRSLPTILGGHQLRAARGGLARGRPRDRLREVRHGRRPVRHGGDVREGRGPLGERPGDGRDPARTGRGSTSSATAHAGQLRDGVLPLRRSPTTTSYEQWLEAGVARCRHSAPTRSGSGRSPSTRRRPSIPAIDEALQATSSTDARRPSRTRTSDRAPVAGLLRSGLNVDGRAALARIASDPTFELLPLKSVDEQVEALPPGAAVSVTHPLPRASTRRLTVAPTSRRRGFRAVPHLSARMVRDRAHLGDIVAAPGGGRIWRVFVVGGDEQQPGAYPDGLAVLRDMRRGRGARSARSACRAIPKATSRSRTTGCCARFARRRRMPPT